MNEMSEQPIVLMVEDDPDVMKINRMAFANRGYGIIEATTVAEGLAALRESHVDLILLDIMLPDGNGMDFCREARGMTDAGILFLTAKNETPDQLNCFGVGGDDYLAKPYVLDVLLIRAEALMRRTGKRGRGKIFTIAGLKIDTIARRAYINGEDALLKAKEYAVLELLVGNRARYTGTEEIYETIWGMEAAKGLSTVKFHISKLRGKIKSAGVSVEFKRGSGYRLVEGEGEGDVFDEPDA